MQQQIHHSHNNHNAPNNGSHLGSIGPVSPARSLSPNPLSVAIMNGANNGSNALSSAGISSDSYFYPTATNNSSTMNSNHLFTSQQYARNNLFESSTCPTAHFSNNGTSGMYSNGFGAIGNGKYSPYMESNNFFGLTQQQQPPQQSSTQHAGINGGNGSLTAAHLHSPHSTALNTNNGVGISNIGSPSAIINHGNTTVAPIGSPGTMTNQENNSQSSATGSKLVDTMSSFYSNSGPYQHLLVAN